MNDCGLLHASDGQNTKYVNDCYALQSLKCFPENAAKRGAQAPHKDHLDGNKLAADDKPLSALMALEKGTYIWMLSYEEESRLAEVNTFPEIEHMELVSLEPGEILASFFNDNICISISACLQE